MHGAGGPLVLLHGAFSTIETDFGMVLPALAKTRQVIGVEQQAGAAGFLKNNRGWGFGVSIVTRRTDMTGSVRAALRAHGRAARTNSCGMSISPSLVRR